MHSRRTRALAALLLALHLPACTTWRPSNIEPRRFIEEERPVTVRVTRVGNEHVYMTLPAIRGDSLAGAPRNRPGDPDTVVVALGDIETLSTSRFSPAKTVGALALVAVLVLGVAAATADWSFVSYGSGSR